jgi:hypothetical protein
MDFILLCLIHFSVNLLLYAITHNDITYHYRNRALCQVSEALDKA